MYREHLFILEHKGCHSRLTRSWVSEVGGNSSAQGLDAFSIRAQALESVPGDNEAILSGWQLVRPKSLSIKESQKTAFRKNTTVVQNLYTLLWCGGRG